MVRAGHGVVCSFLHDGGRLASPGFASFPVVLWQESTRYVAKLPFLSPPAGFEARSSHAFKFCFLSTLDLAAEYLPCTGPFWDSQQLGMFPVPLTDPALSCKFLPFDFRITLWGMPQPSWLQVSSFCWTPQRFHPPSCKMAKSSILFLETGCLN